MQSLLQPSHTGLCCKGCMQLSLDLLYHPLFRACNTLFY